MEWHCWKSEVLEGFNAYLRATRGLRRRVIRRLTVYWGGAWFRVVSMVPLTVPDIEWRMRGELQEGDS